VPLVFNANPKEGFALLVQETASQPKTQPFLVLGAIFLFISGSHFTGTEKQVFEGAKE